MEKAIKCHLCGGNAVLHFEELALDGGKIVIKESPYYKCEKCGENFSTEEQMQELSDQVNSKFVFKRPIINAGRSLAVTLPSDLVQYYKLKKGLKIKIIPKGKKEIQIKLE
ncbi:MAG: YgiT-type zinc finger protein [Candidatus Diapherotrites archaeon]